MGDGSRFTDPDRLKPGWLLGLPLRGGDAALPGNAPAPAGEAAILPAAEPDVAVRPGLDGVEGHAAERAATGETDARGAGAWEWPAHPRPLLATAAGFVLVGGTAVFVRRLARHGTTTVWASRASVTASVSAFARRGERFRMVRAMRPRPAVVSACGVG